jgi:tetratricopeptide (TPR) repeat protein
MKRSCSVQWLLTAIFFLSLVSQGDIKPTCAVLNFEAGAGLSNEEAQFIRARFSALLPKYDRYDVVAESRVQDLLKMAEFNRSDFTSTMDYAMEIGKYLQIRYIIIGSVGRMGDLYSLTTSVVDMETAKVIDTAVTDHRGTLTDFAAIAAEQNIHELVYGSSSAERNPEVEGIGKASGEPVVPAALPVKTTDRRAELQKARRLYQGGLYKETVDAVRALIRDSGPSVDAHILLGEAYAKQKGHYQLAVRELEKAIALDPATVEGRLALARIHLDVGNRPDKALVLLGETRALAPGNPELEALATRAQAKR